MNLEAVPKMTVHLIRRFFSKHPMAKAVNLKGKTIVVTGTAIGSIGYITAKAFASWGADVIVSTRSNTQSVVDALRDDLAGSIGAGNIFGYSLDLSSADSVSSFAEQVIQNHNNRIDVLVNNAGIHLDLLSEWKLPKLTEDNFEIHWRTNYLGAFQLTNLLLPALKNVGNETGDARVVNVVSHLHTKGLNKDFFEQARPYNSWEVYGQSKLALIHMAFEIERKYGAEGVHGYALHPGSIYTNIAHKGLDGHRVLQTIRKSLAFIEKRILLTPEQGAQTQIHCATSVSAMPANYYQRCDMAEPSNEVADAAVADRLWQQTNEWFDVVMAAKTDNVVELKQAVRA